MLFSWEGNPPHLDQSPTDSLKHHSASQEAPKNQITYWCTPEFYEFSVLSLFIKVLSKYNKTHLSHIELILLWFSACLHDCETVKLISFFVLFPSFNVSLHFKAIVWVKSSELRIPVLPWLSHHNKCPSKESQLRCRSREFDPPNNIIHWASKLNAQRWCTDET